MEDNGLPLPAARCLNKDQAAAYLGIGITLLNTVGKVFIRLVQHNPAYGLVGSAVGVLVYLYAFNQVLLFGAAWAATSPHGRVVDLAADDKNAPVGQNRWIRDHSP